MEGGLADILHPASLGAAMATFGSCAAHGTLGLRPIAWPSGIPLACSVATVSPRSDLTSAAAVVGALVLLAVWRRARPVPLAASAR